MPTTMKNLHRGSPEILDMRRFLTSHGYHYDRCNGSHETWVADGRPSVTVNYKLKTSVAKRIKRDVALATALKGEH